MASISSRILRAPRSEQIADPAAPAMISAAAIGAASRTTASTAVAPAKDWAPSWPVRLPTCSEITAPNGIETRIVGISVTLVMNQACSMNSRNWKRVVKALLDDLDDHRRELAGTTDHRHGRERHPSPPRMLRGLDNPDTVERVLVSGNERPLEVASMPVSGQVEPVLPPRQRASSPEVTRAKRGLDRRLAPTMWAWRWRSGRRSPTTRATRATSPLRASDHDRARRPAGARRGVRRRPARPCRVRRAHGAGRRRPAARRRPRPALATWSPERPRAPERSLVHASNQRPRAAGRARLADQAPRGGRSRSSAPAS